MNQKTQIFVFDLDGVITDPSNSQVDKQAIDHIYKLLQQGSFVAINTGRSYPWVKTNLLQYLKTKRPPLSFGHLFIVCEKGGESIKWDNGSFVPQSSRFALSKEVQELSRQVYESHKATLTTMFWDTSKITMATLEKQPQADFEAFKAEQQMLVAILHRTLKGKGVKIDPTTIATDIESPLAGKHAGAELIYDWALAHFNSSQLQFISFGDSQSDYEMARHFAQRGAPSAFVFVGPQTETFVEDNGVKLIRTAAHYAAGTHEYFQTILH